MEEVKIIYCYDQNKKTTHYLKTIKGEKYFCIDCGAELICREGIKNIKHLSHKNTENCGGTGESIFHKHWKEDLFKVGMFINLSDKPYIKFLRNGETIVKHIPTEVEILEVLNEVSLNRRYNKNWDIEIIVDILLITEYGDIVIEINYTNPKDWLSLEPYYGELELFRVYEVSVSKFVNENLVWRDKDDIVHDLLRQKEIFEREKREREQKRIENERKKNEINEYKIFLNYKNELKNLSDNECELTCLAEIYPNTYKKVVLKFNTALHTYLDLVEIFKVTKGIKYSNIKIKGYISAKQVNSHSLSDKFFNLYVKLCKISENNKEDHDYRKSKAVFVGGNNYYELEEVKYKDLPEDIKDLVDLGVIVIGDTYQGVKIIN